METQKLNSLQLELLRIYSFEPDEADLLAIKKLLANYYSTKLTNRVQKAIAENHISEEDLTAWLNE